MLVIASLTMTTRTQREAVSVQIQVFPLVWQKEVKVEFHSQKGEVIGRRGEAERRQGEDRSSDVSTVKEEREKWILFWFILIITPLAILIVLHSFSLHLSCPVLSLFDLSAKMCFGQIKQVKYPQKISCYPFNCFLFLFDSLLFEVSFGFL